MVPTGRLELPRLSPLPPQGSVYTNFTTSAEYCRAEIIPEAEPYESPPCPYPHSLSRTLTPCPLPLPSPSFPLPGGEGGEPWLACARTSSTLGEGELVKFHISVGEGS